MSEKITIIRATKDKDNPYVIVRKSVTQDKNLSWEARGVLIYLLGKPDDWKVKPKDLEQQCKGAKVYRILNELIDAGYIVRDTLRDEQQRFVEWVYYVHEIPQPPKKEPLPEKPEMAQPDMENRDSTNKGTVPSKESTKKDSTSPTGDVGSDAMGEQPIVESFEAVGSGKYHWPHDPPITEDDVVVVPVDGLPDEAAQPVSSAKQLENAWYEAVAEVFKLEGSLNGQMRNILRGKETRKSYRDYNVEPPLTDPEDVRRWGNWWRKQGNHANLEMLTSIVKVQSSVIGWIKAGKPSPNGNTARQVDTNAGIEFADPAMLVQDTLDEMGKS